MKKFLINLLLIVTFILLYLLQVNLFTGFKIARSDAKFICDFYSFYWFIL